MNETLEKIGSTIFAVHKRYADGDIIGGKVIVCRVKSYENRGGTITPILTEVGNARRKVGLDVHYMYNDLDKAVNAIRTS